MMKTIFFLGRQPDLGLAELESLYGAAALIPLSETIVGSTLAADDIDFSRIGGSFKAASILAEGPSMDWRTIEKGLLEVAPVVASTLAEGKLSIGLSVYGQPTPVPEITATSLRLKKIIRAKTGQNVRVVPNKQPALSSAQVVNNSLTNERGLEFVVVRGKDSVIIAKTHREQDINSYAGRDQNRPKRDARVGMLPPKLAQIIINLAVGPLAENSQLLDGAQGGSENSKGAVQNGTVSAGRSDNVAIRQKMTVLDPFCGTGVLLQEAALMGYNVYGTDLEPRMIDYSKANLLWLDETHKLPKIEATLEVGDATTYTWPEPFDAVACEGYLGQPFTGFPTDVKLREVTHTCNQIAKGFLKNIASQIEPGTRLSIALPAWKRPNGTFERLKLLDSLEELGYNRISFVHSDTGNLLYYREDQIVARDITILIKN